MDRFRFLLDKDAPKLAFCVVTIMSTLLVYGYMQERIMKSPYGEEKEFFTFSLLIVFFNRLLTSLVAVTVILVQGKSLAPVAPLFKYAGVSFSNLVSTGCQYEALRYVSFPVQTIAKCAKMIPVMIWGTCIMQKRYTPKDYFITVAVTGGCALFFLAARNPNAEQSDRDSSLWGIILMLGYLGTDGFTSTLQDMLFKGYNMEIFNQILYVTIVSGFFSMMGLILQGQLFLALNFVMRHPDCLSDILMLSLSATSSQFAISYTIRNFGALIFATIMTTRQLLSIILSCIVFVHPLTLGQWAGAAVVFGALYYKSYSKSSKPNDTSVVLKELVIAKDLGLSDPKLQPVGGTGVNSDQRGV